MRICEECGSPVTDGTFYADIDGDAYCADCLRQMGVFGVLAMLGYPVREMCGSSVQELDDETYAALRSAGNGGHHGYQTA